MYFPCGWPRVLHSSGESGGGNPVKVFRHRTRDLVIELRENSVTFWHARVSSAGPLVRSYAKQSTLQRSENPRVCTTVDFFYLSRTPHKRARGALNFLTLLRPVCVCATLLRCGSVRFSHFVPPPVSRSRARCSRESAKRPLPPPSLLVDTSELWTWQQGERGAVTVCVDLISCVTPHVTACSCVFIRMSYSSCLSERTVT